MSKQSLRHEASLYFVPFLLGSNKKSMQLSIRLFLRYGIMSYVLQDKPSFLGVINPACKLVRLSPCQSSELLSTQLLTIAEREPWQLPILIPCNKEYACAAEAQRSTLESTFVFCEAESLFSDSPLTVIP